MGRRDPDRDRWPVFDAEAPQRIEDVVERCMDVKLCVRARVRWDRLLRRAAMWRGAGVGGQPHAWRSRG